MCTFEVRQLDNINLEVIIAVRVPCDPGYHGTDKDPQRLFSKSEKIGYPVSIRAIHGGCGKSMCIVSRTGEFGDALEPARRKSLKLFGDDDVLVERYIQHLGLAEVQVFADVIGAMVSLWEQDCSLQRRNQKITETPDSSLSPALCATSYFSRKNDEAGIGEFILDNNTQNFYVMETYLLGIQIRGK
ncbi:hypothetical protein ID866_10072 [Astraeus odoratus]|nr:hypothetical protein ID866_10072 [Astraeus odoratus]